MKKTFILVVFLSSAFFAGAQQFWIENWTGTNCAQGCTTYTGPNGAWSVVQSGYNGPDSNAWYFSEMETGEGRGACGAGGGAPATAHVSFTANSPFLIPLSLYSSADQGAVIDDYSGSPSTQTNLRLESPTINCTGKSGITLSFNYIMGDTTGLDYATVWYYNGSSWSLLASPPSTPPICPTHQGLWTYYSVSLPSSANNNPSVRIGFNWHSDTLAYDDNYILINGYPNPSFAVDSIALAMPCPVIHDSITVIKEVSCSGDANGSVLATATNGTAPFTYLWSPSGGTNSNATGLTAGGYTITITDANGCVGTASTTITQPNPLTASIYNVVEVKCFGDTNGRATASVSGGTPGYTYSWAPSGETTLQATGLSAGSYTFSVTDANGCMGTASITITQPSKLIATINVVNQPSAPSYNNGSLSASGSGGVLPYSYIWTPGGQVTRTITGLTASTYKLCITDSNGCQACDSVILNNSTASVKNVYGSSGDMVIYPNPANNTINLVFAEPIGRDAKINITDLTGRVVESPMLVSLNSTITLDISQLAQGIYFVRVYTEQSQFIAKFIKQ